MPRIVCRADPDIVAGEDGSIESWSLAWLGSGTPCDEKTGRPEPVSRGKTSGGRGAGPGPCRRPPIPPWPSSARIAYGPRVVPGLRDMRRGRSYCLAGDDISPHADWSLHLGLCRGGAARAPRASPLAGTYGDGALKVRLRPRTAGVAGHGPASEALPGSC